MTMRADHAPIKSGGLSPAAHISMDARVKPGHNELN
jgi:hypothetical protein